MYLFLTALNITLIEMIRTGVLVFVLCAIVFLFLILVSGFFRAIKGSK